jgi:serine/threonine protein phosphatase 1
VAQLIVGDIHGCFDELSDLLAKAGLSSSDDIVSIGDMLDRGPNSPAVLRFFRTTSNAGSLFGNHERKHVRARSGQVALSPSQLLAREQFSPEEYAQAIEYMGTLPHVLDLDAALLVHAFLEPRIPLEQQDERVLVGTLGGRRHLERNYARPWWELYRGHKSLIVGHKDYTGNGQPFVWRDRVYGIDTSCCHGRRLTGILLPEFRIIQVPSRRNYWSEARIPSEDDTD